MMELILKNTTGPTLHTVMEPMIYVLMLHNKEVSALFFISHYYNANMMNDILSGRSVKGCFQMANLTPMMWFSKKQATSDTTTYGVEFLAARICVEQIID